jgi:hypothetical protein
VNARVIRENLDELYYGHSLYRLLHYIVSLRLNYPSTKILLAKTDLKGAYRRITLHGDTAARCIITLGDISLLSLRLTFGGSPCPNEFCVVSEIIADLANDILHSPDWDPKITHSPHTISLPLEKESASDAPFQPGKELDVQVPLDIQGKVEIYIDDGITAILDINNNKLRGSNAMALAIHTICRPISVNELVQRDDCLSLSKLAEEGTLSESAKVLGWKIDTRSMLISLPPDKFNAWNSDIKKFMDNKKASKEELDTLIGRLNHAAGVLPLARYYLNRIRRAASAQDIDTTRMPKTKTKWLSKTVLQDLHLFHETFLPKIHMGISINLLTYRRPTHIIFSDACPKGLGGYSVNTGKAWRWEIPTEFEDSLKNKNNTLEFLAAVISIWMEISSTSTPPLSCILALGDNTSAVGWLHNVNVDESDNKALHIISRKLAALLMSANCCLYSQHFKGEHNEVADTLSRRHDLSDSALVALIFSSYPDQIPGTFKIDLLPPSIISWMIWLLQKNKDHTESNNKQKTKKRGHGADGELTWNELKTPMTHSYNSLNPSCDPESSELSQQPSDKGSFQEKIKTVWREAQLKRPWQNWAKSSGQTWGSTPTMAQMDTQSIPSSAAK